MNQEARTTHRAPHEAAFTLLELLAAIVILGILTVLLFEAFRSSSGALIRQGDKVEVNQVARAVLDQITRDLERTVNVPSVVNLYKSPTGGSSPVPGSIPADTLYALSDLPAPDPNPYGSFVNIGYQIAKTNAGPVASKWVLMRGDDAAVCTYYDATNCPNCCADAPTNWWNYFNPNPVPTDPGYNPSYWKLLSENVIGIQFSFSTDASAANADNLVSVWSDTTTIQSRLPYAVKVTVYIIDTTSYNQALAIDPALSGAGTNIILRNMNSYSTRIFLPRSTGNP